jgi:SSS family solute:Na+ symporter
MNYPLFFFLLFVLGAGCLWIGKKASAQTHNNDDYFLAGRTLGVIPLMMTLLATQLGGGALMGAAEEAYTRGWIVLCYPLGMVLGLLVLGLGFGAKIRKLQLTTVAEIFEKIYHSPGLRKLASLLSIISLFLILVAQGIAARKFFLALGFESNLLFSLFWGTLIIYTMMGGLRAVVNTDILQASFILLSFLIVIIGYFVCQTDAHIIVSTVSSNSHSFSSVPWLTWLLMPLLFMLIEQDMGQRCFAARRPGIVSLSSCLAAGILFLTCLCPIYFGTRAGELGISIPEGSSALIASVKALTNPIVSTFMIVAILMAIISTADSLLNSISSNLSCDFSIFRSEKIKLTRLLTCGVGLSTLGLSFLFDNVVSVLMFSYELSVSILFVPILMGVLWKRPKKFSAIIAIFFGGLGFLLFRDWSFKELWSLGFSFIGFCLTEVVLYSQKASVND